MTDGFLSDKRIERGSWRDFERAVGRLFTHRGWPHVALVGGPGDHGGDVLVSSDNRDVVIQVKYKSDPRTKAGKRIVSDVKRAMEFYDVNEGLCVTNTVLSPAAKDRLDELNEAGYDIQKLNGSEILSAFNNLPIWPSNEFEPYEYQKEPIRTLTGMYDQGYDKALLSLATGLGKTFVAGRFIKHVLESRPDARILVLADQKALVRQFDKSIWSHLPKTASTHLWYGSESPEYESGVDVGTFQTLKNANRLPESKARKYDLVVVDEAHHAPANSYRTVLERTDPEFMLGLTATPWRNDDQSLEDLFGPVREELTIDVIEALRKGYLTDVDYRMYCDDLDWENIPDKSDENYTVRDLNKRLFIQERDDEIIEEFTRVWKQEGSSRSIIYSPSIDYAKRMSTQLRDVGYAARPLHSDLDNREIERRLRAFRRGDLEILTAVDMLNEGVDIPEVDLIVFLRVTHSRRIFLQQLGRGLRLAENKEKVVVMDLVADIRRVADAIDIEQGVEKGTEIEVMSTGFSLNFQNQNAQSFFREYLNDKAAIATKDGDDHIRFPE